MPGVSSIRRVVKAPERWPRIVELARQHGDKLPPEPDSGALNAFLMRRKQADPVHYADVSLAVLKLMGPGEYVLHAAGRCRTGPFRPGGARLHPFHRAQSPLRRPGDAAAAQGAHRPKRRPYADAELDAIARNCTLKEDAARKVQRDMNKRLAAVALQHRVGQTFSAVVTGVTPKGVFVRVLDPPVEGRLMRGEQGLDVGDRVHVTLLGADPQRGFIDFGRDA